MKKIFLVTLLSLFALQCKKDEKVESTEQQTALSVPNLNDSASVNQETEINPSAGTEAFKVVPYAENAEQGKAIFSTNGNTVFSFNTESQTGKIIINGTTYLLNKMIFSENTYHLYGNNIEISAEDGAFEEMTSDCAYGKFSEVFVKFNDKQSILRNVKVQDCPKY